MKYCAADGLRYPDSSLRCRSCGALIVYEFEVSDPTQISTSCCPKPDCSELVAQPNYSYCRKCGTALEPISVELWERKILEPAFAKDPVDVLLFPSPLFTPAAEMGLEQDEVRNHLDRFIAARAGVNRTQVDQRMKDTLPLLTAPDPNVQELQGPVRNLAAHRRLAATFSSEFLDP